MSIEPIAFWGLAVVLVGSALAVVLTKNLFHSVLWLALALTGTAGVFLLLDAEFLAAVQLLLYAGGVVTIVVFAIVVTERLVGERISQTSRRIAGRRASSRPRCSWLVVSAIVQRPARRAAAADGRRPDPRDRRERADAVRAAVRAARRADAGRAARRDLLRAAGRLTMGLQAYLMLAAVVFCIGLFGVITRRNTIGILLGIELMLNAVNINLVAFARFSGDVDRHGLHASSPSASRWRRPRSAWRIVILLFRVRRTVMADHLDLLKG